MDAETLDKIQGLVERAHGAQVVRPADEPKHVYWLQHAGTLERHTAAPEPRNHTVTSIDSLVVEIEQAGEDATVWVSREGVTLLWDDDRRDKVRLPLSLSAQVLALGDMAKAAYHQKDLVYLLRTTFRDCLELAGDLVEVLRRIRFSAHESADTSVQHGRTSIGKSLSAELTGTKTLPEYVTLNVPVFAQAGFRGVRVAVECSLEPDAATGTFKLAPIPGSLEHAVGAGERQLFGDITAAMAARGGELANIPVLLGKP